MFTAQYVSGKGYTVRDATGRVVAHSLTSAQWAAMSKAAGTGLTGAALLAVIA